MVLDFFYQRKNSRNISYNSFHIMNILEYRLSIILEMAIESNVVDIEESIILKLYPLLG